MCRWVSKINPLTYAYTAMIKSQFDATTFYDAAVSDPCLPAFLLFAN